MNAPEQLPAPSTSPVSRSNQIAESLVLAALLAAPALVCMHAKAVADPDIWLHMRTGQWILQHHAIPRADSFTQFGAGRPWADYSWLFDLLVFKCFQRLGLTGLLLFATGMILAITTAIYHLIRRLQSDFSLSVLLTLVASLCLARVFSPRSWLFSILFFVLQLDILMNARKTGRHRQLLWLPVIYALWANLHIQFFDGLVVLGIAAGESILSHWWTSARTRLSAAWLGGTCIACILATLANPYGWNIYKIGFHAASQPAIFSLIGEYRSLPFRSPADFCMLFLALAAACALGWSRRLPLFEITLLAFAAITSFRSERDMWIMIISASAILAQEIPGRARGRRPLAVFTVPVTAAAIAIMLFLGIRAMHLNNAQLRTVLAESMPVNAVKAIREQGYQGPLYNTFSWGDYLIWDLRMPVSIDGRTDFNGDPRLERFYATWNAQPDWASDPDLQSAGLVIGPVTAPLTQLLRIDPRFQLAYQDKVAVVFTARRLNEQPAIQK
ncbi:MAG: hypothetical protein WA634_14340 [Silvibacterium sp.]